MVKLTGEEREQLAKPYTTSSEAYQVYVRGRYRSGVAAALSGDSRRRARSGTWIRTPWAGRIYNALYHRWQHRFLLAANYVECNYYRIASGRPGEPDAPLNGIGVKMNRNS